MNSYGIYYIFSSKYFCVLGFFNGVLLLVTGASAGLDIYKQELGCEHITPGLDDNVALINVKQKELVEMKDNINIRWVTGKHRSIFSRKNTENWA